jgi:hypothetical protein
MRVLYNDPETQLLAWRLDERALRARLEIRRQLGPRPSVAAQLCAGTIRSAGGLLIRCGQWLAEHGGPARPLDVSGQINPAL